MTEILVGDEDSTPRFGLIVVLDRCDSAPGFVESALL